MKSLMRHAVLGPICAAVVLFAGCPPQKATTTDVGLSVATMVKTTGLVDTTNNCNPASPAAPDIQSWWNALPPNNRLHPYVGFELWRNTTDGCLESRKDVYRGLVTFNMASVSNLKGLVQKAELVVSTYTLPSGVGTTGCMAMSGGAAALERFGPASANTLPPVQGSGSLDRLQPNESFPTGQVVFNFPNTTPLTPGAVSGATSPTTVTANGTGGVVFTVDVTSQVNAALNGGIAGMSWMLDSSSEGPLPGPAPSGVDCKTAYSFKLTITHL
jgi:hypothetical protein